MTLTMPVKREVYDKRLKFELDIIIQMGFPSFSLSLWILSGGQKITGVPVGSRGSGAGSLVAMCWKLPISILWPMTCLFERF